MSRVQAHACRGQEPSLEKAVPCPLTLLRRRDWGSYVLCRQRRGSQGVTRSVIESPAGRPKTARCQGAQNLHWMLRGRVV